MVRVPHSWPDPEQWISVVPLYLAAVAVILFASRYLYGLSYIRLDDTGIAVQNWTSLISDENAETQWYRVTSVDSEQRGLLAQVFGYGTLVIQQAGTAQPVRMTMVPHIDYWKDYIQDRVARSPELTHDV